MMEVVAPLRIEPEAEQLFGSDHAGVVEIALRDRVNAPSQLARAIAHRCRQILKEWLRGMIDDRVHCIDAQRIDVKLIDPHQRVVNEKPADMIAVWAVEVQRLAPWRLVTVSEVRPELAKVVSLRPEMVVDHVENQREIALMRSVDEALQAERTPV